MRNFVCGTAAILAALTTPSSAQDASEAPPHVTVPTQALQVGPPQAAAQPTLLTGTEVPLTLLQELTTKNKRLRVGHRFRLETSDPIMVDGVAVIPAGTPAMGEITEVRNKGMWGKSGRFVARLLYLTVNGRRIRLMGEFDDKGTAGGAGAVAVSALVFLPAGFFMTGTSALLPAGTEVKGFIDEDVPLATQVQPATAIAPAPAALAIAPRPTNETPAVQAQPSQEPGNARVRCETCR